MDWFNNYFAKNTSFRLTVVRSYAIKISYDLTHGELFAFPIAVFKKGILVVENHFPCIQQEVTQLQ